MGPWWQNSHKRSLANTLGLYEEHFPIQVILPPRDDEIAQLKITSAPSHFFSLQQKDLCIIFVCMHIKNKCRIYTRLH